jgi:hypothetical protein
MGIQAEIDRRNAQKAADEAAEKAFQESQKKPATAPVTPPTAPVTTTTSTSAAPPPAPTATDGVTIPTTFGDMSPGHWGVNLRTGDVNFPGSQQVADWQTVANSNIPIGPAAQRASSDLFGTQPPDFVKLRADADAARRRLGPAASATADLAGNLLSPTNLATAIPVVGPGIAGGSQAALQSYGAGDPYSTVGSNMLKGGVMGETTLGLSKLANPKVLAEAGASLVDKVAPAAAGYLTGGSHAALAALAGLGAGPQLLQKPANWIRSLAPEGVEWPRFQAGLQQLLYGGGSLARQSGLTGGQTGP